MPKVKHKGVGKKGKNYLEENFAELPSISSDLKNGHLLHQYYITRRSTVEMMCRELGAISDFQTAEHILANKNTIGFDATTQEGDHVNEIHVTSADKCHIVAVDPLAGGTAEDYEIHINQSVDNLAEVYCAVHQADKIKDNPKTDFPKVRSEIVASISNSMTDRAAVNHATIARVEISWGKTLNELNCHLHPLEAIATECRKALQKKEPTDSVRKVLGSECFASGLVLGFNKFRYKDATGDPKGFILALAEAKLPRGLLPRYRGNRLHIMFLICARLFEHQEFFRSFLKGKSFSCNRLKTALQQDLDNPVAVVEIQVLGLLGKFLTGPWMSKFYQGAKSDINYIEGINIVKDVFTRLDGFLQDPGLIMSATHNLFGEELPRTLDLVALQKEPVDKDLFFSMMEACLEGIRNVLVRQYKRYFDLDVSDQLRKETESARLHNIDAEQVMGMFSALKDKAPNVTLCFMSCKIRAQKNKVLEYLDSLSPEKREKVIKVAVSVAKRQRQRRRRKCAEIQQELKQRLAAKKQLRENSDRRKLEARLKKAYFDCGKQFPEMEEEMRLGVEEILGGKVVGRKICHIWFNEETRRETMCNGQIEKYKQKKGGTYVIGSWGDNESYDDDATD